MLSTMNSTLTYGDWLKAAREDAGMTQKALALAIGLKGDDARTYISTLERGKINMPNLENRERIHAVLGTSEQDLIRAGIIEGRVEPAPTDIDPETAEMRHRAHRLIERMDAAKLDLALKTIVAIERGLTAADFVREDAETR